jgi:LPXTG-motif cell wall-anchored protein
MSLSASTARRLAALTLVGGLAVVPQLVAPAANAAEECYAAPTTSDTALSISPANPTVGQPFTATATVSAAGTPVTSGTVTFGYAGTSQPVAVSAGVASTQFTAQSAPSDVTASYAGECLSGSATVGVSSQSVPVPAPTVAGVEENAPPPTVAGTSAVAPAGLAATGVDTGTELLGVAGLGLLAIGGATLLLRRRRSQA